MSEPPLLVVPLPARLPVVCALLDALSATWEAEYGTRLTTAHLSQQDTPWGPAMVVALDDPTAESEET